MREVVLASTLLLVSVLLIISGNAGSELSKEFSKLRHEAVQHGFAYYDPRTAEFTWKKNNE